MVLPTPRLTAEWDCQWPWLWVSGLTGRIAPVSIAADEEFLGVDLEVTAWRPILSRGWECGGEGDYRENEKT
ncbi:MAG: hypothetical protein K8J08_21850 [Thermoanaerobaculia bacterium]|nr:hypothetical protein [Thermoanaerobaculia bacterium]